MHEPLDNPVATTMAESIIKAEYAYAEAQLVAASIPEPPPLPRKPLTIRRVIGSIWWFLKWVTEWVFGLVTLLIVLSVLATIPVVQFLSLGYLLESAARIARPGGRLRDGLIGVRQAATIGGATLGTWILLQPLRLIADFRREAALFSGYAESQPLWNLGYGMLLVLLLGQIAWALYRGGRLRSFFWPAPLRLWREFRQSGIGGMYVSARDRVYEFVTGLRLPYYFLLGLRGAVVALGWLVIPISVMVLSTQMPNEPAVVLTALVGGLMLAFVLLYVPFAQINFAISGQIRDGFDRRRVRQQFCRAPLAFWTALLITLLFALPVYLLKAELIPREAAWLPSLVFVLSILPARLLTGWAVSRAEKREQPRHWVFRWMARLSALPVVLIYALIVNFTPFISWYGPLSLYEQHAFLLPVPFLGL